MTNIDIIKDRVYNSKSEYILTVIINNESERIRFLKMLGVNSSMLNKKYNYGIDNCIIYFIENDIDLGGKLCGVRCDDIVLINYKGDYFDSVGNYEYTSNWLQYFLVVMKREVMQYGRGVVFYLSYPEHESDDFLW